MNNEMIENIFRNSNNSNELFDAFHSAIESGITDIELYRILLCNHALSDDEICMYVEKLSSIIVNQSFNIFILAAELFELRSYKVESSERALQYYARASKNSPGSYLPYKKAIGLYDYEINQPLNKHVIKFVEDGIPFVSKKSELYKVLAKHFQKIGDDVKVREYKSLAQKAAERE